jgi:biopolymer transport protein TolQ
MDAAVPADGLSVTALFAGADFVVKLVMLVLVGFSLLSWAIILQRFLLFGRAIEQSRAFLLRFQRAVADRASLDPLKKDQAAWVDSPVVAAFSAGYEEWGNLVRDPAWQGEPKDVVENVSRALRRAGGAAIARMETGLSFLASSGSAAPFIGLFGTVWGILRAFQRIGATGTTSIAEVGPHIAEALVATAVGLFAAIPAVLAFNFFVNRLKTLGAEVHYFGLDFLNLVERSERTRPRSGQAAQRG